MSTRIKNLNMLKLEYTCREFSLEPKLIVNPNTEYAKLIETTKKGFVDSLNKDSTDLHKPHSSIANKPIEQDTGNSSAKNTGNSSAQNLPAKNTTKRQLPKEQNKKSGTESKKKKLKQSNLLQFVKTKSRN